MKNTVLRKLSFYILLLSVGLLPSGGLAQNPKVSGRMIYHNGQVMTSVPNVYFIWYGCWAAGCPTGNEGAQEILVDFAIRIGGSPYLQINTTYPDGLGRQPSGALVFGGSVDSGYTHGPSLTEADAEAVIGEQFTSGNLPLDTSGIYILLTSSDVFFTGFCSDRCQYHKTLVYQGTTVRYATIGNPARCPSACAAQFQGVNSPNAHVAADAM